MTLDLRARLGERVRLVDGGLGSTLEGLGADLSVPLWSARVLVDQPDLVQQVHESFFRSGAEIAVTASYQVSEEGFARAGRSAHEAVDALRQSVRLARAAADAVGGERLVAASVGPYGATLADGSEYHGRYGLTADELTAFHRRRVVVLDAAAPDLLAIETLPTVAEAEAVLASLDPTGPPVWVSFTCGPGARTAGGDPVEDAGAAAAHPRVVAVGVNCTAVEDVAEALSALAGTGLPLVACPNAGGQWDAVAREWVGSGAGDLMPSLLESWVGLGARLVGGCCGVSPEDIATLDRLLP